MSRALTSERSSVLRLVSLSLAVAMLLTLGMLPARAQELPPCPDAPPMSDCLLPPWPEASLRDAPSLFGTPQDGAWVTDPVGDVVAGELDIQAIGVAPLTIGAVDQILDSDDLLVAGARKKAVKPGSAALVRIVLDRPLQDIAEGHASIHVATDVDGARTNNAPAGVARPDGAFAGMQDVYSLSYATTTQKTSLLASDLSKAWYKRKRPFAADWAAPNVLDVLVPAEAIGDGLKVVTYVSGPAGGYDSVALGPGPVPVFGRVRLNPVCSEASISGDPFVVGRLIENGQTLRDVTAPASWRGGVVIPLAEAPRAGLEALVAAADEDGDGRITLPSTANLFEDGLIVKQRPEVALALEGDTMQLALEVGLTRRGYTLIRAVSLEPTGDAAVDAFLNRAVDALVLAAPAFRTTKKAGLLYGSSAGSCATRFVDLLAPSPDTGETPPASDGAATSA